jgi:hypothetical protein
MGKIIIVNNHSLVYFVGHLVCVIAARGLRESYHPDDTTLITTCDMIEITRYVKYDDAGF